MDYNKRLLDFISLSPTGYQAVEESCRLLEEAGFKALDLSEKWQLQKGCGYYVTQNMSSLIAFRVPEEGFAPFAIAESHCDSPAFRIKRGAEVKSDRYLQLNTEIYGGPVLCTWFDRPLTAAGRLSIRTESGVESRAVFIKRPLFVIPTLAPHLNREINNGYKFAANKDMLPLMGSVQTEGKLLELLAEEAGCEKDDILAWDLYAVNLEKGYSFGVEEEYLASPRIDNLSSVFASVDALINCKPCGMIPMAVVFNKEEIGSTGRDGAESTFLSDVAQAIAESLGATSGDLRRAVAGSFALSADNGHAVHPNHPEKSDPCDRSYLGGGIMIKQSPAYSTDGFSAAVFKAVCEKADVPVQFYSNRADMRGGSTLGNISIAQFTVPTVDIGLPQLGMHSSCEVVGKDDPARMEKAMETFFSCTLIKKGDSAFEIK